MKNVLLPLVLSMGVLIIYGLVQSILDVQKREFAKITALLAKYAKTQMTINAFLVELTAHANEHGAESHAAVFVVLKINGLVMEQAANAEAFTKQCSIMEYTTAKEVYKAVLNGQQKLPSPKEEIMAEFGRIHRLHHQYIHCVLIQHYPQKDLVT